MNVEVMVVWLVMVAGMCKWMAQAEAQGGAVCYWGPWGVFGPCKNGYSFSRRYCFCDHEVVLNTLACGNEANITYELCSNDFSDPLDNSCIWTWGDWSPCSRPCGSYPPGNTTRSQDCVCYGNNTDNQCVGEGKEETESCNFFECQEKPHSALYWVKNAHKGWPMSLDTQFYCSKGDEYGFSKLTWFRILSDPLYTTNIAWHYLAKEYITTRLNKAAGCILPREIGDSLQDANFILSNCLDFTSSQISSSSAVKEKLSRYNNGIGGSSRLLPPPAAIPPPSTLVRHSYGGLVIPYPLAIIVPSVLLGLALLVWLLMYCRALRGKNQMSSLDKMGDGRL